MPAKGSEDDKLWKVRTHDVLFKYLQNHREDQGWKTLENNKVSKSA